jgi:GNAT superfamily N-acetyltransferase
MRIEPARTDDIAVYVVFAEAAQAMLRARGLAQWVPAAHAEYRGAIETLQAAGSLFGVFEGATPLAFFVVTNTPSPWWPPDAQRAVYLSGIVVSRAAHGRALGHMIVAWTIARAEAFGARAVRLDCHRGNEWLRRYYEDLGFVLCGVIEQHPGYDGCLYEYRCGSARREATA